MSHYKRILWPITRPPAAPDLVCKPAFDKVEITYQTYQQLKNDVEFQLLIKVAEKLGGVVVGVE